MILANDLAALEGLATTGYVVRTGDGTASIEDYGRSDNDAVLICSDFSLAFVERHQTRVRGH